MTRMTPAQAVARLDAIDGTSTDGTEPPAAHSEADSVLLQTVHPDVRAAYERLVQRATWWVYE